MKSRALYLLPVLFIACSAATPVDHAAHETLSTQELSTYSTAYFASGCFWCVEAIFESVKGVKEAESGYSGGHTTDPTYRAIGTGTTGHSESVKVYYDSKEVSYEELLTVYFDSHDPTTANGQRPDFGSQYRSIAFYETPEEKALIDAYIKKLTDSKMYTKPIATEVTKFEKFYIAEDYHQNYERLHPNDGYVRQVSIPRLKRFQAKHPELLK